MRVKEEVGIVFYLKREVLKLECFSFKPSARIESTELLQNQNQNQKPREH